METLGDRVKKLREDKEWSQDALAKEVTRRGFKITQAGISNIEKRGNTNPQCLPELAEALSTTTGYLRTGKGTKERPAGQREDAVPYEPEPPSNASLAPHVPGPPGRHDMVKDVPVYGTVVGGNASTNADFELNGEIVDYVRRPPRFADRRDVFAAYYQGESMLYWREPGQLVYFERARAPRVNDYVLVELKPGHGDHVRPALIKRLLGITPTKVKLRQYNPPRDFEIDRNRIHQIVRAIDLDELLGV